LFWDLVHIGWIREGVSANWTSGSAGKELEEVRERVLGEVEDKVMEGEEGKELGEGGINPRVGESGRETETEFEEEGSVGEESELVLFWEKGNTSSWKITSRETKIRPVSGWKHL
jgi:hypothetical protein